MSIFSEIKALIDATAVTQTYRRGYTPTDAVFPYADLLDPLSSAPALSGDSRTLARRRLLQVDLWQTEAAEAPTLPDAVVDAIDGVTIASGFGLTVQDLTRVPETEDVVHHAITVSVVRLR